MKWIGERISFVDDKTKTTVVIEPKDIGWLKGVMGAWVFMWYVIGITAITSFYAFELNDQEKIILFVFLAFWGYYAYKVTKSWFWIMWGKELIKVDEASLSYKRSVRKFGKSTPYLLENITKMRMYKPDEKSFQAVWEKSPWIVGGERIEFDYMGKVIRFGRKLEEKDAELLFKLLTKRIDQRVRNRK